MTEQLQISLLGAPDIRRDGQPLDGFAHRKSLALLCYLAATGKPHSRAALAGLLWGDSSEANARGGLRKSLAELRRVAGPNLVIKRHEVAIDRDSPYWLDVNQFDQEAEALRVSHGAGLDAAQAATLARAVDLYQGEFLDGFHVLRARLFEDWILMERERLRLAALRMTYALSIHHLTQADYAQAISYAEQVLAIESCHEEAHRLLMSLLALSGQQTAALRQYQTCREALAEELGLDPDEETIALYERISDGLKKKGSETPLRPQLERPSQPLIGRRQEMNDILSHLQDPRCRLLTLLGPGGSGKTHLAREIAAVTLAQVRNGSSQVQKVFLIAMGSSPTIDSLTPAIAQGAGLYFSQEGQPRRQLLSYLRRQHALLILDACEGLLNLYDADQGSFVDLIDEILEIAPGITILVTSRARLNLPAETVYPLAGMTFPEAIPAAVDQMVNFDAVQLFLWRMARIQPGHKVTDSDLMAIAKICRFAKGMPLEILLMANWARLLDPPAIFAQLSGVESKNSTAGTPPLLRDLRRNLKPVFDHSWNLLGSSEQNRLLTMSLFRSGFTYENMRDITGISHRELMVLVDQSLISQIDLAVQSDSDHKVPHRFEMHDLLREYVGSKLAVTPILNDAQEQYSSYFMGKLQDWAEALLDAREQEALQAVDIEIANIGHAWIWAAGQGCVDLLKQGLDGLCRYYQRRFRYSEGESACQTAVHALTQTSPPEQRLLAKLLAWQGFFATENEHAMALLNKSLALLNDPILGEESRAEKALAWNIMGGRLLNHDHELAKSKLKKSLAIYTQLGEEWHAAQVLHQLFIQSWKAGTHLEGEQYAKRCLALYEKIGYRKGAASVLGDQGIGQLQAGLAGEGMQSIKESIEIFEELADQAGIVKGLYFSGMALAFTGQWSEADERLHSCVIIGEDHCNFFDSVLIALAIVKTHRGQYAQALSYAQSGLERATELNNQMCIGRALSALSLTALGEGDSEKAEEYAEAAVTVYQSFGQNTELGLALAALGYASCQNGAVSEAQESFNKALNLATAYKDQMSLIYAFVGIAYLLTYQSLDEQAITSYTAAARHPVVASSRWFQDIVKKRIDQSAAALSPDQATAATARGQSLNLW